VPSECPELEVDDIVRLRKPHPCGADRWRVTRIGADIGLRCLGCERRILLGRAELRKRLVGVVERPPRAEQAGTTREVGDGADRAELPVRSRP
jgi:hypothetical protein